MAKILIWLSALLSVSFNLAQAQMETISGDILRVNIGEDGRYQIYHKDISNFGAGQVFPHDQGLGDYGWFVAVNGALYGPNAQAGVSPSPFTGTTISSPTGNGSSATPFEVKSSGTILTGVTYEKTDAYVNGENFFRQKMTFNNATTTPIDMKVYMGGDIYLSDSDEGKPVYKNNAPGGEVCDGKNPVGFNILLFGVNPVADHYTADKYSKVWNQIETINDLDDMIYAGQPVNTSTCLDNGAAIQWNITIPANGSSSIQAATSFGAVPPTSVITNPNPTKPTPTLPNGSTPNKVPTLSAWGLLIMCSILMLVWNREKQIAK